MSCTNPTGDGDPVDLTLPADHVHFLRGIFKASRSGVREELATYPEQLRDPARLRREDTAYGRLLAALDEQAIVPDADTRVVLGDLAEIIDAENEYSRVVMEHEAHYGLLDQLAGGESDVR